MEIQISLDVPENAKFPIHGKSDLYVRAEA